MNLSASKKLNSFFRQYKNKYFKKHETLLKAGDEPQGLYSLKEGIVRQYAISPDGDELTINMFKSGAMFPVAWVVNDSISPHYFEAISSVHVWIAPKNDVLNFFKQEPDVLLDLVKRIYTGLDGYFLRMEQQMAGGAQARLIAELLIYARRFGEKKNNEIEINLKITQRDLAAQSGMTRETVSRELQKLKAKGLVMALKNKLIITKLSALEEELLKV